MFVFGCGFLKVLYEEPFLLFSYGGNMGCTKQLVSDQLVSYGLPPLSHFEKYPSFSEEGSPDYIYTAKVDLSDISLEDRVKFVKVMCDRIKSTDIDSIESIDERLRLLAMFKKDVEIINELLT